MESVVVSILRDILDRLMKAPGEAPEGALTRRSDSTRPALLPADPAGKPVPAGRDGKPESAVAYPTVYLLLDVSGSMDQGKLRQARDGGISFAKDALRKGYLVGVIQFSSWARLQVEPTTDRGAIKKGLSKVGLQASTNMAAAIELATNQFGRSEGQRAIVLVTDGYPDDAAAALAAAQEAKRHGITIIAIGTDDADRLFLKKLASASELATTVPDAELKVAIASAARLLPARSSSSR